MRRRTASPTLPSGGNQGCEARSKSTCEAPRDHGTILRPPSSHRWRGSLRHAGSPVTRANARRCLDGALANRAVQRCSWGSKGRRVLRGRPLPYRRRAAAVRVHRAGSWDAGGKQAVDYGLGSNPSRTLRMERDHGAASSSSPLRGVARVAPNPVPSPLWWRDRFVLSRLILRDVVRGQAALLSWPCSCGSELGPSSRSLTGDAGFRGARRPGQGKAPPGGGRTVLDAGCDRDRADLHSQHSGRRPPQHYPPGDRSHQLRVRRTPARGPAAVAHSAHRDPRAIERQQHP